MTCYEAFKKAYEEVLRSADTVPPMTLSSPQETAHKLKVKQIIKDLHSSYSKEDIGLASSKLENELWPTKQIRKT